VDASASGLQGPSASIDTQYTPQAPPGVGAQQHSSNQAQIGAESIGSQGSSTNAHSQSAQSGLSDNPGIAATRSQAYAGAGAGGSYGSGAAISSQPLDSASSIGQVASTTQQKAGGGANGLGESTLTGSPQPGRSGMPSDHLTSIQQQAAGAGAGSGASGPYQSMLTASSPAENSGASNGNTASSIVYQASANVSGSQGSILTSDPQLEHDISQGVSGQAASSTMPLASPYAGGSQRSAFTTALSATGFAGNGTAGKASSAMSISGDRGGLPPAIASANPQSGHDTSGVYIGPGTSSTQLPAGAGADSSQGSSFTAGVQSEQSIAEPSNVHDNSSILLQVGSVEGGLQTSTITVNRQSAQVAGETSKYQMRTTTDEIKEPVLTDSALSGYSTNQAGTGTQKSVLAAGAQSGHLFETTEGQLTSTTTLQAGSLGGEPQGLTSNVSPQSGQSSTQASHDQVAALTQSQASAVTSVSQKPNAFSKLQSEIAYTHSLTNGAGKEADQQNPPPSSNSASSFPGVIICTSDQNAPPSFSDPNYQPNIKDTNDPLSYPELVAPLSRINSVQGFVNHTLASQPNITAFETDLKDRLGSFLDEFISSRGYTLQASEAQKAMRLKNDTQNYGSRSCDNLTKTHHKFVTDIYFAEMIINTTYQHYQRVKDVYIEQCR